MSSLARTVALALPKGKFYGRYWVACCPAHDDHTPSLTIADAPSGRLLLHCKAGCSFAEVVAALQGHGLITRDGQPQPPSLETIARLDAEHHAQAEHTEQKVLKLWRECQPLSGTKAETYLRSRRITYLPQRAVRFHPACWHPSGTRIPAMVALVEGLPRLAVHRTYLRLDGSAKADIEPAKAMLGATSGGAVRLTEDDGPLVIAEGIETALSLSSGLLSRPATIWAALSASGIAALHLPLVPDRLTIASDGDRAGNDAAHKLAERAAALGWTVSLLPAPEGRDWNDILQMKGDLA